MAAVVVEFSSVVHLMLPLFWTFKAEAPEFKGH